MGGPIVGSTVGLIVGFHRVIQGGGIVSFMCLASLIVGLIAGFFREPHGKANCFFPSAGFFCHCRSVHGNDSDDFFIFLFFSGDLADGATLVRFYCAANDFC